MICFVMLKILAKFVHFLYIYLFIIKAIFIPEPWSENTANKFQLKYEYFVFFTFCSKRCNFKDKTPK